MTKLEKVLIAIVVVVIGVATIFGITRPSATAPVATKNVGAQYQNDVWYFTGTPYAQVSTGEVYNQGGQVEGNPLNGSCSIAPAASTTPNINLTAANLTCATLIVTTATTSILTLTLPASSTLSQFTNLGDGNQIYIDAASSTGGNLQLLAGTGFQLNSIIAVASSTAASTTIVAGDMSIFDYAKTSAATTTGILSPSR